MSDDVDIAPPPVEERSIAGPNRAQRFSARYGWRAIAIPIMVVTSSVAFLTVLGNQSIDARAVRNEVSAVTSVAPSSSAAPAPTTSAAPATAEGEAVDPSAPAAPTGSYVEAGDSSLNVVPGTSAVLGTGGPVKRFAVEVEGATNVDGVAFAAWVEQTLADPRSWGAGGRVSFQRVDSGQIDFYVALVSPAHVESLCPGYGTNGYTSCRYGNRAVINLARWSVGVPAYDGHLVDYRHMVLNHEIGHWLGNTHVFCPGPGRLAPVMQQQTLDMQGCTINAWPYPNGPNDNPVAP